MRSLVTGLAVAFVLTGCQGGAPASAPAAPSAAADHAQLVAGLGGDYVWNCTLISKDGDAPWRFVLRREGGPLGQDVVILEAESSVRRPVEVRKDNAARVYTLRDGSNILIASDGELRGGGRPGSRGAEYTSGRCIKGRQPA